MIQHPIARFALELVLNTENLVLAWRRVPETWQAALTHPLVNDKGRDTEPCTEDHKAFEGHLALLPNFNRLCKKCGDVVRFKLVLGNGDWLVGRGDV
ncbi:hypothetical protein HG531_001748 [Fusarium graminearum]|nr:hypothetical protein HG531_001748 [Fusarium graminearum]